MSHTKNKDWSRIALATMLLLSMTLNAIQAADIAFMEESFRYFKHNICHISLSE